MNEILRMLMQEQRELAEQRFIATAAAVYGAAAQSSPADLYKILAPHLTTMSKLSGYCWIPERVKQEQDLETIEKAKAVYQALAKAGVIEAFDKLASEEHNRLAQNSND